MQQPIFATFCRDWLAAWMGGSAEKPRAIYAKHAYYSDQSVRKDDVKRRGHVKYFTEEKPLRHSSV